MKSMISSTLSPSIALAAYAESFVDGRRVVVFGDATSGLAEYLIDRGARLVHVYDADPARIAEASTRGTLRSISFAPLGQAGIAVRDAAFDFGIIENLTLGEDPSELLRRLARALSARAAALIAVPNPDARLKLLPTTETRSYGAALGYYELYDRVAEHFAEVRMLGQLPFVGYAVADFGPERDPQISIDTALVPGGAEEPEWFLAFASQQPLDGESFTIVELPFAQVLRPGQETALDPVSGRARAQEQVLLDRIGELESAMTALKEAERQAAVGGEIALGEHKQQLVDLKEQIGKRDNQLAQFEARVAEASARAQHAETELLALRQTAPATESAADASAREELQRREDRIQELERETEIGRAELAKYETTLRERGAVIQKLEHDLKQAERLATELARELSDLSTTRPEPAVVVASEAEIAELRAKLENLTFANAEREANLLAADWTIGELEAKLAVASTLNAEPPHQGPVEATGAPLIDLEREESSTSADLPR